MARYHNKELEEHVDRDCSILDRKVIATLATWNIWNERNTRLFLNKLVPPVVILDKFKRETSLWVLGGAKHLCEFVPAG
jgi:hypothetical protein